MEGNHAKPTPSRRRRSRRRTLATSCFQGQYYQIEFLLISNWQQWLKHSQELMSSTASNYDISKLIGGQVLAAITLFSSLAATGSIITSSLRTVTPLLLIAIVYGVMIFASSYVEEEQHFWYWATTAWLMLLWIKKYVLGSKIAFKAYHASVIDNGRIAVYLLSSPSIPSSQCGLPDGGIRLARSSQESQISDGPFSLSTGSSFGPSCASRIYGTCNLSPVPAFHASRNLLLGRLPQLLLPLQ